MKWKKFRRDLAFFRNSRELSVREVGEESGVPYTLISRIERGSKCGVENFERLCKWMRVKAEVYWGEER